MNDTLNKSILRIASRRCAHYIYVTIDLIALSVIPLFVRHISFDRIVVIRVSELIDEYDIIATLDYL